LKEQRAQIAAGSDDQTLRMELAQSLYVSALAQTPVDASELKEALVLLAKLPVAMQNYRSVNLWRERIGGELRSGNRSTVGTGRPAAAAK
jgi:hypothetical protein